MEQLSLEPLRVFYSVFCFGLQNRVQTVASRSTRRDHTCVSNGYRYKSGLYHGTFSLFDPCSLAMTASAVPSFYHAFLLLARAYD